jgi:hypothetical protein
MPGATPFRSIRYPLPGEPGAGDLGMETMARDLDASYTATDALRAAALGKPRAALYRSNAAGTQSVAKGANVTLTFSNAIYDNAGGMADLANNRLLCKKAGLYYLRGATNYSSSATMTTPANVQLGLSLNGATTLPNFIPHKVTLFDGSTFITPNVWAMMLLAVNDVVTLVEFWTATAPAGPNTVQNTWLEGAMLCTNP